MQKPYHGSSRGMTKEDGTPKSNILGKSVPQPFWTVSPRKVSYSPIPKKEKKEKMAKVLKYYVLRINSKQCSQLDFLSITLSFLRLFSVAFLLKREVVIVLGTSTARQKIHSAHSKIYPLEERSCSKCSKKISLGFCSARYVLEKSSARARSARIFYARNARSALGMEHKKLIILDGLFIVCSE